MVTYLIGHGGNLSVKKSFMKYGMERKLAQRNDNPDFFVSLCMSELGFVGLNRIIGFSLALGLYQVLTIKFRSIKDVNLKIQLILLILVQTLGCANLKSRESQFRQATADKAR